MDHTTHQYAVAGDWHADTQYGVQQIRAANQQGATHIIHLGDFGYQYTDEFLNTLTKELTQHDLQLWFVDGNHENFNYLNNLPINNQGVRPLTDRITHLPRGYRWQNGGTTYMAFGGAVSVDKQWRTLNESWWPAEQATIDEFIYATTPGSVDVVFAHDTPHHAGVPVTVRSPLSRESHNYGKMLNQVWELTTPKHWWHGHYHLRYDNHYGGTQFHGLGDNNGAHQYNLVMLKELV